MPNLQYEDQVAVVKQQLQKQWEIEANQYNQTWFSDSAKAKSALAKLNAKYQRLELDAVTKIQEQQKEQQRVQDLIGRRGQLTERQEATERLRLDPEAERLVFPPEPRVTPITRRPIAPEQLKKAYGATIDQFMGMAKGEAPIEGVPILGRLTPEFLLSEQRRWAVPRGWEKKKATQGVMNKAYSSFLEYTGYAQLSDREQRQLDMEWDFRARSDNNIDWDPKNVGVQRTRALHKRQSPLTKRAAGRRISGSAMGMPSVSPIGSNFVRQQQPKERVRTAPTRQQLLDEYKRLGGGKSVEGRAFADQNLR